MAFPEAAIKSNVVADQNVSGIEMSLVRCKYCNRPQMEVSDPIRLIRWKCKSCRNWNAVEIIRFDGNLKVKWVGSAGR
jgi:phage FluMu protein Com